MTETGRAAVHIAARESLPQDLRDLMEAGLDQDAQLHDVPRRETRPLVISASVGTSDVVGALAAKTYWTCLAIDLMWVRADLRRSGIGGEILTHAEAEARKRGCAVAVVDTVSFQAPGFYLSCGYVEAFRIPDVPPGHSRIYLTKRLV